MGSEPGSQVLLVLDRYSSSLSSSSSSSSSSQDDPLEFLVLVLRDLLPEDGGDCGMPSTIG